MTLSKTVSVADVLRIFFSRIINISRNLCSILVLLECLLSVCCGSPFFSKKKAASRVCQCINKFTF